MDSKHQQRSSEERTPPPADMAETDIEQSTRRHKAHQMAITRGLRKFYESVAAEPVPEEFMELLRKIDASGSDR